jgi:VWFA-related protein
MAALVAQPQQPVFRSGVELIRVDVTVIDRHGTPIRDLDASDFVVRVDGKLREVRTARFFGPNPDASSVPAVSAGGDTPAAIVSNTRPPGRIIVFFIDRESIRAGTEKALFETAARLMDTLSPADAVALAAIPGPAVELTRDHAAVRDALRRLSGTQPKPKWKYSMTLDEARAWEIRDARRTAFITERECPVFKEPERAPGDANPSNINEGCPRELREQADEMLRQTRAQARTIVTTLAALAERLRLADNPKHVVLFSGGMSFELDTLGWFREFARRTAEAQITLYAVHIDQPPFDASDQYALQSVFGGRDMKEGLMTATALTGGAYFSGIGTGKGVFERMRVEMENVYQLGVDGEPGDADGQPHQIRVEVKRPGVTVRARREVVVPPRTQDAQRLTAVLRQPVDVADLPVTLTAFSARGDEPDTLKVVLLGEIAQGVSRRGPYDWGILVMQDGKPIQQTLDRASGSPGRVMTGFQLAPGRYQVRFAAVDELGGGGSVELPLSVGLRAAGDLQFSDLFVGTPGEEFQPAITAPEGTRLLSMLELYTLKPELFQDTSVAVEVRPADGTGTIATVEGQFRPTESDRRQVVETALPTEGLQPGSYTVSATISVAGAPVGKVTRAFIIAGGQSRGNQGGE